MLHFPNAKINIGLFVTQKRPDQYHDLETIFYPVPMLKDALELLPASSEEDFSMNITGLKVEGTQEQNLVFKAYQLLQKAFPEKVKSVQVHLLKAIPMGAGLGGGSADGAFMLKLLNRFFELGIEDTQLAEMALQLGSDCPFFIYNKPMLAFGRGEQLEPIDLDLSQYSLQLICPKVHVSTAQAFQHILPKQAPCSLKTMIALPIKEWKDSIYNDFEASVFSFHPLLAKIKNDLYAQGALYSSMSGSGSAFYAFFEKGKRAQLQSAIPFDQFYFE